jgi:hypothetical protein
VYDEGESDIIEVIFVGATEAGTGLSVRTALQGNYPNPFNPTTEISFSLQQSGICFLDIYNVKGEKVTTLVEQQLDAGTHTATWNGTDSVGKPVSSGVYFYRMKAGNYTASKKMILMK